MNPHETQGALALNPEAVLAELQITLPTPPKPVAAYIPFVRTGNLVFISGQVAFRDGQLLYKGFVDTSITTSSDSRISMSDAQAAAKQCMLNTMAILKSAVGSLSNVRRCVRLGVFIACDSTFVDHPKVANGASELLVQVFGDAGKHARAAVGSSSLPLGACVEVESVWEVDA